jgi:DnaJ-domain-containing protein 1
VDRSFQVVLESCTTAQEAYTAASAAEGSQPNPSLFAQVEQLLGEKSEPDPDFFIDSWTLGVAAASENFRRRRQDQKVPHRIREHAEPAFQTLCSFPPFFTLEESPKNAEPPSWDAERLPGHVESPSPSAPSTFPLTIEAASDLLGIAADSTRDQIKIAYRKMASRYHPDRLARRSDLERQLATDRMASINEAYRLLCEARLA